MNDLTYGATLLACFATLIAAALIESNLPPERTSAAPAAATAKTAEKDCTTVALAPATERH